MRATFRVAVVVAGLLTLVLFLQAVVAAPRAQAQAKSEIVRAKTGKTLDEYLTRLEKFGFSGAVIASKDGEIILSKGYGWADRAKKIPFTPETVSSIGSITKQFTAAGILKLETQGKLRVEDPIGKFLTDVPPDKAGITIHHLLTHTAGFRGNFGGRATSLRVHAARCRQDAGSSREEAVVCDAGDHLRSAAAILIQELLDIGLGSANMTS